MALSHDEEAGAQAVRMWRVFKKKEAAELEKKVQEEQIKIRKEKEER